MNDLLVVVLCYSGDQAQVERQLDAYLHHGAPVLALSPEDAPAYVDHPQVTNRWAGLSGWKGRHVSAKLLLHWKIILEQPQSWFLMHEPDTVCLKAELPEYLFESESVLWCINPKPEGGIHSPPWFCHRSVLERLAEEADAHLSEWDDEWCNPEGDGAGMGNSEMMSTAVNNSGVEWRHMPESEWTYKESDLPVLLRAISGGADWIHGLKTPEGYLSVVSAFAARNGGG